MSVARQTCNSNDIARTSRLYGVANLYKLMRSTALCKHVSMLVNEQAPICGSVCITQYLPSRKALERPFIHGSSPLLAPSHIRPGAYSIDADPSKHGQFYGRQSGLVCPAASLRPLQIALRLHRSGHCRRRRRNRFPRLTSSSTSLLLSLSLSQLLSLSLLVPRI